MAESIVPNEKITSVPIRNRPLDFSGEISEMYKDPKDPLNPESVALQFSLYINKSNILVYTKFLYLLYSKFKKKLYYYLYIP